MAALKLHCHNSSWSLEVEGNPWKTGLFLDAGRNIQSWLNATFESLNEFRVLPILCQNASSLRRVCNQLLLLRLQDMSWHKKVQDCTRDVRSCWERGVRNKGMLKFIESLWRKSHGEQICQKPDDWREQMTLPNVLGTGGCTMAGMLSWIAQLNCYMIGVFKLN